MYTHAHSMEGSATVAWEVRDSVAVISLTRPARLNALTNATVGQLRAALMEIGDRADVRAVVLRGEGRAFCAGLDLELGIADPSVADPVLAIQAAMRLGIE